MNSDPLAQLRDIHLPEPVSWWPPAPGWWVLALVVLGLLVWGGVYFFNRFRSRQHRRAALRELAILKQNLDSREIVEGVAVLLKRVALQSFDRKEVASLSGARWLAFLDHTGGMDQFSAGPGRILAEDIYSPMEDIQAEPVIRLAEEWIRRHRQC